MTTEQPIAQLDPDLLGRLRHRHPTLWINDALGHGDIGSDHTREVASALARLEGAQALVRHLFPETAALQRPISSDLTFVDKLASHLGFPENAGRWVVKADHRLPVAGSIKARGGFHEVIAFAERLAIQKGLMPEGADLMVLASPAARKLFADYSIIVGSTGNLGLSIGMMSSALGFNAIVHMSNDAKAWKKQRLRESGATVVEHAGDYADAVAEGRRTAARDPFAHFVDDEHSLDLFVGYAAAAKELQSQLLAQGIEIGEQHPLFVYLPCGVGGAPGGITYGLKAIYGGNVHCFFVEPVASPCVLVQMASGVAEPLSVYDIGLDNRTEADGLAVGQASLLVAPLMMSRLSGVLTVRDEDLFMLLAKAHENADMDIEPSAAAGFAGPFALLQTRAGQRYLDRHQLKSRLATSTHVIWTTGGLLVPQTQREAFIRRGHGLDPQLHFEG